VAQLAGISAEYYVRLEQGRYRNPSAQVVQAVARALRLDAAGTRHLARLAGIADFAGTGAPDAGPERHAVSDGLAAMLCSLGTPAYIESPHLDVLAANREATALSPRLAPGHNRLLDVFLDPDERALFEDWEGATAGLVAAFHASAGTPAQDPRTAELVATLTETSPRFAQLFARHDVGGRAEASGRFLHPVVGAIHLHRHWLTPSEDPSLTISIFHAEPGSEDTARLARLIAGAQETVEQDPATGGTLSS